ncbi:hypothetical protein D3C78_1159510 [compost metagenome]
MHQHENQTVLAQSKPQQRQRQQGDGRQGVEHRSQGAEQITTELRRHCQCGQGKRQDDANQVTLEQHHQRNPYLAQQFTTEQTVIERMCGLHKARQQQVVVLIAGNGFPQHCEQNQNQGFAQPTLLPQSLAEG